MKAWPRAGKLFRLYIKLRNMAIDKNLNLNLSEARKEGQLDRFMKEHPSIGDEGEFDRMLREMAKKPKSRDQTSNSSHRDEG